MKNKYQIEYSIGVGGIGCFPVKAKDVRKALKKFWKERPPTKLFGSTVSYTILKIDKV